MSKQTEQNDPQQTWWDSERRDSPYSTVADLSDEDYCEGCDQTVDYSDGSKHGRCGCDEIEGPEPDGYRQTLGGPTIATSR